VISSEEFRGGLGTAECLAKESGVIVVPSISRCMLMKLALYMLAYGSSANTYLLSILQHDWPTAVTTSKDKTRHHGRRFE
jgi:hypothetical protein